MTIKLFQKTHARTMAKLEKQISDKAFFRNQVEEIGVNRVKKHLLENGFAIFSEKYHVGIGEIDLVAGKDDLVCFVEVKTRKKAPFPISQTVNLSKQKKLILAGKIFATNHGMFSKRFRFDVATVLIQKDGLLQLEYIENAFCEQN